MNNSLPKISVIIPCFNCEQWIIKCIDSITNQDYEGEIEIICVDDCSQDNTIRVIESYAKEGQAKIVLLKNTQNMGPGKSRNIGIEHSTGEWIAFCDSDDWYDDDYISLMILNALENESDIVMCNYKKILESNDSIIKVDYLKDISENYTNEECIVCSKASLCLLVIKKELFEKIKIPDLRNGEDIAVVPVLESRANKITFVRNAPYNYLIRKKSASNNVTDKVFYSLCRAYTYIINNLDENYKLEKEYLGIRTLLYGATMNGFKAGIPDDIIKKKIEEFIPIYPEWYKNQYMKNFTLTKRVYLLMIRFRCFPMCKLLSHMHGRLSV